MPNPFTHESRDARIHIGLDGFVDKLRAPDSIAALLALAKPLTMPNSDFVLKSILDEYLIACILRSDYRAVQGTLGTLFGPEVTVVTSRDNRHAPSLLEAPKEYRQAQDEALGVRHRRDGDDA